jgi:hypothetical protein
VPVARFSPGPDEGPIGSQAPYQASLASAVSLAVRPVPVAGEADERPLPQAFLDALSGAGHSPVYEGFPYSSARISRSRVSRLTPSRSAASAMGTRFTGALSRSLRPTVRFSGDLCHPPRAGLC